MQNYNYVHRDNIVDVDTYLLFESPLQCTCKTTLSKLICFESPLQCTCKTTLSKRRVYVYNTRLSNL